MSETRQRLPEELEQMPAGLQLAMVLASVDRRALSGQDRVRLARARNRLVSHANAELLADLCAVTWDEPPAEGRMPPQAGQYPWSEVEVAYALVWTAAATGRRMELARQLVEDFPQVLDALRAGLIDMPRALVIGELAGWLDDRDVARSVVDRIIRLASELTTGQLRARLRRLVLAVDPDAASRRCAAAVSGRRVESFDNPDGTGELWGRSLPPQDTAAVWERLTAIARAAKSAGDPRSIDQLRADALLDLLAGEGVAVGGPVTCHTAGLSGLAPDGNPAAGDPAGDRPAAGGSGGAGVVRHWDPQWPVEPPPEQIGADQVWPDPVGEPVDRWDEAGRAYDGAELWPSDWPGRWLSDPAVAAAGTGPSTPITPTPIASAGGVIIAGGGRVAGAGRAAGGSVVLPGPRRGVVELQVPLTTLLRLSDHPGELGGFGPVVADIARQVAGQQQAATWRFSVYNKVGDLAHHGIVGQRPTTPATAAGLQPPRPAATGPTRHPTNPPATGPPATGRSTGPPTTGPPSGVAEFQPITEPPAPSEPAPGERAPLQPPTGHPVEQAATTRRQPTAQVAAFVRARDRTCVAPGCRRAATGCDVDHTVDWAHGGPTDTGNLGLLCRRHHLFKHAPGTDLIQFTPGVFGWTTPRGMQYVTRPEPCSSTTGKTGNRSTTPGKSKSRSCGRLRANCRQLWPGGACMSAPGGAWSTGRVLGGGTGDRPVTRRSGASGDLGVPDRFPRRSGGSRHPV